jgi:hypothetical protein
MKNVNLPLRVILATVFLTTACLVDLSPALPTPTPDLASTAKAATLTAAPSLTATLTPILATETPTITLTPFPSITPLPTSTPTVTLTPIGYFETSTPTLTALPSAVPANATETPDPDEGYSSPPGSEYACALVSKNIANGTPLVPGAMYKMSWTLVNVGVKKWDDGVIATFMQGSKMNSPRLEPLREDVKPGRETALVTTFFAPKAPGHYRAVWGLRVIKTERIFCMFTINVTVP